MTAERGKQISKIVETLKQASKDLQNIHDEEEAEGDDTSQDAVDNLENGVSSLDEAVEYLEGINQ